MAHSLLAHLYTHIRGAQEDIATLSLQYLLSQSQQLNVAFTKCIERNLGVTFESDLQFFCQQSGKEMERPDMSGIDDKGREQVICEMKFYAGLTHNQPLAYIDRLKENGAKGLVFICPSVRMTSLWAKLKEVCMQRDAIVKEGRVLVDGVNMTVISWTEVLEVLLKTAAADAQPYLSDIKQLEGYCTQMDSDAFIPFTQEELTAENAKRAGRFYDVVDEVINLLHADDSLKTSLKGVKATAWRQGYTRSIAVDNFKLTINYDREMWKRPGTVETPFWIAVRGPEWEQTEHYKKICSRFSQQKQEELWNMTFLALETLPHATLSEVSENLKEQILEYLEAFRQDD